MEDCPQIANIKPNQNLCRDKTSSIKVEIKLPPSNYFILDIDINIGNNIEMKNLQNLFSRLPN